jgi:hypothetical protein
MEAIRSSEMSGATQRTTWRHIEEDDTLHNHRCENLKSYFLKVPRISNKTMETLFFIYLIDIRSLKVGGHDDDDWTQPPPAPHIFFMST